MASKASVRKANGQHPAPTTDTSVPTDSSEPVAHVDYHKAVVEIREILAQIDVAERGYYRIGELAHEVAAAGKYGDRTLAKLAEDSGVAKCVLDRYATVYKAWKGILAPGLKSPSYSVLRELAPYASDPECAKIIRESPHISKREALDLKRRLKGAEEGKGQQVKEAAETDEWLKHNKKWFKDLVVRCQDVTGAVQVWHDCSPEQQSRLLQAVEPNLLMYIRQSGKVALDFVAEVKSRLEEDRAEDEAKPTVQVVASSREAASAQAAA